MELDDIRTYCRIVTALKLTIAIQEESNIVHPEIEEQTLFSTGLDRGIALLTDPSRVASIPYS